MNYLHNQITRPIPQTEPLDDRQVKNNAGGYSYKTNIWTQLDRFLLIGTEGGTFYVNERKLTFDNIKVVDKCLEKDGDRVLKRLVDFSVTGRAYRQDQILYVLARAFCHTDTKKEAERIFNKIVRTGYHLFLFISFIKEMRGMGRAMRRTIASWYLDKDDEALSYQLLKYQNRNGWTHKDVLALCHAADNRSSIRWALDLPLGLRTIIRDKNTDHFKIINYESTGALPSRLEKYETLCKTDNKKEVINLIETERFTHEMVPNQWKNDPDIWIALLNDMPVNATLRNLGKLASLGLLDLFSDSLRTLENKFSAESLSRSKVHPMSIFLAAHIYRQGHGRRGGLTWETNDQVRTILESAFYDSFSNVKPIGKNVILGLDVSGSMSFSVMPFGLSASDIAAAIALITVRTEPSIYCLGFSTKVEELTISKNDSLSSILEKTARLPKGGGTNCAAPLDFALDRKIDNVDLFVTYTDNETWSGYQHPAKSLEKYRKRSGREVGHIIVAMTANEFTIADPEDSKSLDICGFDAAIPSLISEFGRSF